MRIIEWAIVWLMVLSIGAFLGWGATYCFFLNQEIKRLKKEKQ